MLASSLARLFLLPPTQRRRAICLVAVGIVVAGIARAVAHLAQWRPRLHATKKPLRSKHDVTRPKPTGREVNRGQNSGKDKAASTSTEEAETHRHLRKGRSSERPASKKACPQRHEPRSTKRLSPTQTSDVQQHPHQHSAASHHRFSLPHVTAADRDIATTARRGRAPASATSAVNARMKLL